MELYSYQQNCLIAVENDPSHSQLISMPTGTGKTITFLSIAKFKNKKTLILVHRRELLNQTYDKAIKLGFKDEDISLITSEDKGEFKHLTIAMVPTLIRNLDNYNPDFIEMIIIDEAHHATANSYREIIKHFKIFEEEKILLGFTATPLRGDKAHLGSLFLSHSYKMTLSEATQNGYICPVHGIRIEIDKSLEEIDTKQGDYDISALDRVMNCEEINKLVAIKAKNLKRNPGIIFCTSVDHAQKIAKCLRKDGIRAISISYNTPKKTIDKIYQRLYSNKIDYITNAVKLSEGFDFPPIQSILIARPTRSPVLYKQMIGRGLRNFEGKKECIVLEFTGNDKKLIKWEDIDENCTYQSVSGEEKRSYDDAKKHYKNIFSSSNVKILDVRISPFKFYECFIQRKVKYGKEYLYYPAINGFCMYKFLPDPRNRNMSPHEFGVYMWFCFWKEKYKSFYVWSEGNAAENQYCSREKAENWIEKIASDINGQKRWYPSEEAVQDNWQKQFLSIPIKMSARKTEMYIEDGAIKEAIKKYWMSDKLEIVTADSSHESKVYNLSGKY